jgi:copper chaperone CopZ
MKQENIIIANLSCGGCVKTITKELSSIAGLDRVEVDLDSHTVLVNHSDVVSREEITRTLLGIGYPEITEKNGLLTHLKSITSCMKGKLSN